MKALLHKRHAAGEQRPTANAEQAGLEAFGQLYDLYFDKVFGYAYYKIGDRYAAEDIAEQSFLKALEDIAQLKEQGPSLLPQLLRIASGLITEYPESGERKVIDLREQLETRSGKSAGEEGAARQGQRQSVLEAMNGLTEQQRQVIAMRFMADMTSEEIAEAMDKKPSSVRALQRRAIAYLTKALGDEYEEAECG